MLSKNNIKFINSLKNKKFRFFHRQFIAEGEKIVQELLISDFKINKIIATEEWFQMWKTNIPKGTELISTDAAGIKKVSDQKTSGNVLAVIEIPDKQYNQFEIENELSIALDDIQDPGNLGTIIRTADWFGVKNIFCSQNSVDVYNPKVVQSTMGAIFRVNVWYIDLKEFLEKYHTKLKIYGTYLNGKNIYDVSISKTGIIVFGNESKGINENLSPFISELLYIPTYSKLEIKSESLNLAASVAVILAEFKR